MLEQKRILLKILLEQQAEWKEERTRMLTDLDHSRTIDRPENPGNQSKNFQMVEPLRDCGRAKELDKVLETLQSIFASHKHLFPRGDPNQVRYAVTVLETWDNHPDPTQRQTENSDPSKWASDQRESKDLCLDNFKLFTIELQKMYRDKEMSVNSATKVMQE